MTYQTLISPCWAVYEIKKSQFLAFAYPIVNKDELVLYINQLRLKHPDARHICYGYILGDPDNTTHAGFDDDGEPSGTAGRPILNVLQHKKIGNCAVLVVRYFGGVKLGAGGLTRAYSTAAQMVVNEMNLAVFVAKEQLVLMTDFAHEAYVRHQIELNDGQVVDCIYEDGVILTVLVANQDSQALIDKLAYYAKPILS